MMTNYDRNVSALDAAATALGRPLTAWETHSILHPQSLIDTPERYQEALERTAAMLDGEESLPDREEEE